MVVRMRLSPHRRLPSSREIYYRIVVSNAPRARDSKPLETVGAYDPYPKMVPEVPAAERSLLDEGKKLATNWIKRVEWDRERVGYWLGVGAQPTRRVAWLLEKAQLIPPGRSFHGYKGPKKPKSPSNTAAQAERSTPDQPKPQADQ